MTTYPHLMDLLTGVLSDREIVNLWLDSEGLEWPNESHVVLRNRTSLHTYNDDVGFMTNLGARVDPLHNTVVETRSNALWILPDDVMSPSFRALLFLRLAQKVVSLHTIIGTLLMGSEASSIKSYSLHSDWVQIDDPVWPLSTEMTAEIWGDWLVSDAVLDAGVCHVYLMERSTDEI